MRNLLDFIAKYNYWFIFALCEVISIVLLVRFNNYQSSTWFTTANAVSGKVYEWESGVFSYIHLGEANRALTNKNIVLEQRVNSLVWKLKDSIDNEAAKTDTRQDELLNSFHKIDAKVVDNSVSKKNNYITIDRGSLDGVKPEMGVVCGTGVVGIVFLTSEHYSLVIPILSRKSEISCKLRGRSYFGNLKWDGKSPLYVTLNDIPRHARVKVGDAVETSGFSEIFPEGLFVGKVSHITNSHDGMFFQLKVHLGIDFASLREVCVVYSDNQGEMQKLKDAAEEADSQQRPITEGNNPN